jgi:hypothetical protein
VKPKRLTNVFAKTGQNVEDTVGNTRFFRQLAQMNGRKR